MCYIGFGYFGKLQKHIFILSLCYLLYVPTAPFFALYLSRGHLICAPLSANSLLKSRLLPRALTLSFTLGLGLRRLEDWVGTSTRPQIAQRRPELQSNRGCRVLKLLQTWFRPKRIIKRYEPHYMCVKINNNMDPRSTTVLPTSWMTPATLNTTMDRTARCF